MKKLDYRRCRKHKGFELAFEPKKQKPKGGWTHIKRQPVRQYTSEEIAAFVASNPPVLPR